MREPTRIYTDGVANDGSSRRAGSSPGSEKKEGMAIAQNLEGKRWKAVEGDRHHPERRAGSAPRSDVLGNRHVAPLGRIGPVSTEGGIAIGGF